MTCCIKAGLMLGVLEIFIAAPDSGALYTGHYDPVQVTLPIAVAILASYVWLVVSQHAGNALERVKRRIWLGVGGLCMGLGVWAAQLIGMAAFSLPGRTGYDLPTILLAMVPGILTCTLALVLISRVTISIIQLWGASLLLGLGLAAAHYTGMAALRFEGLLRYDLGRFLLSIAVASALFALALWIKSRLRAKLPGWYIQTQIISAVVLGLAVSGMHYAAMAAAYFLRDTDGAMIDTPISVGGLAATALAATSVFSILTLVASYVVQHKMSSARQAYKVIGALVIGWCGVAWWSAAEHYDNLINKLYRQEVAQVNQQLETLNSSINENLRRLAGISQVYAQQEEVVRALRRFGPTVTPSLLGVETRKRQWTQDRILGELSRSLSVAATHLQTDTLMILNAAGDSIAAANYDKPGNNVGTGYAGREYFQRARDGHPGFQYALGWNSKVSGLYYAHPVIDKGRFLGAVVVKRLLSAFSRDINQAQAFITDANGVIVLASSRELKYLTMPDAGADRLSVEVLQKQYGQSKFKPLGILPLRDKRFPAAVHIAGSDEPSLLVSEPLIDARISIYAMRSLREIERLGREKYWYFALLAAAACWSLPFQPSSSTCVHPEEKKLICALQRRRLIRMKA